MRFIVFSTLLLFTFVSTITLQTAKAVDISGLATRIQVETHPFDNDETFIRNTYKKLLHREADADGLATHLELLSSGKISRPDLVKAIRNSEEYKIRKESQNIKITAKDHNENILFVKNLYRELLGRDAEAKGLNHAVKQLETGLLTRKKLKENIIASDEFRTKFPNKKKGNNPSGNSDTSNTPLTSTPTSVTQTPPTSNTDIQIPTENGPGNRKIGHFPFPPLNAGIIAFQTRDINPQSRPNQNRNDYVFFYLMGLDFKKVMIYHVGKTNKTGEVPGRIYVKVHQNGGGAEIIDAKTSSVLPQWHQWKISWGNGEINIYLDEKLLINNAFTGTPEKAFIGGHKNNGRSFKGEWRNFAIFDPNGDTTGIKTKPIGIAEGGEQKARLFQLSGNICGAVEFETCGIQHQTQDNKRGGDFTFMVMKGDNFKQVKLQHTAGIAPDGTPRAIRYVINSDTLNTMGLEVASDNLPDWHKWRCEYGNGIIKFYLDGQCIGTEKGFHGIPKNVSIGGYHNGTNRNFKGRWRNFTKE